MFWKIICSCLSQDQHRFNMEISMKKIKFYARDGIETNHSQDAEELLSGF